MTRGIRQLIGVSLLFAISAMVCGCGSGAQSVVRTSFVEFSPEQQEFISSNTNEAYRIQANDVLKIVFLNQKDLDQESVLVLPDGAVSMIGIDRLLVAGLSVVEADSAITQEFAKEFRDPNISVIVKEANGLQVYVLGEVNRPGLQKVPKGGLGLIGAVSLAGGFTDDAAEAGAVLVRVSPEGYLVKEIDLSSFYYPESMELAMVQLLPNDIIYVPRSRIADFGYFSKNVLGGLVNMTRIATDLKFLSTGTYGRP